MKTLSTFMAVFALATAITTNPINAPKGPPAEEQVTALKGIDDLNVSMWSGFINIKDTTKNIHYMYIETTAANKTGDEPLIVWFNGGPGCSSMLAMFQENGPFLMNTPTQALNYNAWSWTDFANVVWIDQPAGVGFSTCNSSIMHDNVTDCTSSDDQTGQDNLLVIQGFLEKYGLKDKDLYISGESYGGIYVPMLAYSIHNFNTNATESEKINLKGMMVGNGVTNWTYDTLPAGVDFAYYRGLISTQTHDAIVENKCNFTIFNDPFSDTCGELYQDYSAATERIDVYNVYGDCLNNTEAVRLANQGNENVIVNEAGETLTVTSDGKMKNTIGEKGYFTKHDYSPWLKMVDQRHGLKETPPCVYSANIYAYLNDADVRTQLHIPDNSPKWDMCRENGGDYFNYTMNPRASQYVWEALMASNAEGGTSYQLLKFSGDKDMSVPTIGSENWINALNMTVAEPWRQYYLHNNTWMGGIIENFENGMTFATVHGAGHMVPQDQPEIAHYLISNWIKNPILN